MSNEQERWWDSPTFTGQTDDAGNPLFSDADAPEYTGGQEQPEIYPGVGIVDARINPVTGFHDVTFTGAAWTNLLALLGYARACASLEKQQFMEQGAQEMIEALRRADLEQKAEGQP